jgi:hypothetical protein
MRVTRSLDTGIAGGSKASTLVMRVVEKTSASSALRREKPDTGDGREKPAPRLTVELVCQDETPRFDPFWDAPRLMPAFVTQVLGQVMPQAHTPAAAAGAYSAACPRKALLLDRKS